MSKQADKELKEMLTSILFPIYYVLLMWAIFLYQTYIGFSWRVHGIIPRRIFGLKGILTAPLLHSDWGHIFSNTIPFLSLAAMLFIFYKRVAYGAFFIIYLLTGFAVWIFAKDANHIGASGVVYGLVAFIFWSGIFRKNRKSIVLALVVLVAYSGYFLGIVPGEEGISWESHLLGGIVGMITAFLFKGIIEQDEKVINPWMHEATVEREYMFRRDLFDMTLEERRIKRSLERMEQDPDQEQYGESYPNEKDELDITVEYIEL